MNNLAVNLLADTRILNINKPQNNMRKTKSFLFSEDSRNIITNISFLLCGFSLFLFYRNMLYLHSAVILLMILMLVKCYYQGMKDGVFWLMLVITPMIILVFQDGILTMSKFSEILLILVPSLLVGLLADKARRYVKQLKETYISTLKALAAITDARDSYTQGHSERVARYSTLIAKEMRLSDTEIDFLEQASLLHDIGKIAVPDRILNKKEPLSDDEWIVIKRHSEYSQKILSNLTFLSNVLPIVLYHHNRFDDKKFPLETEPKITMATRILTVADAYDAMTSDRPYRDRLSSEEALMELKKCSGAQFDPGVVKIFEKAYGTITKEEL
mgnify:CR=1 FL=1